MNAIYLPFAIPYNARVLKIQKLITNTVLNIISISIQSHYTTAIYQQNVLLKNDGMETFHPFIVTFKLRNETSYFLLMLVL